MAEGSKRPHPHIYLKDKGVEQGYTAHQGGGDKKGGPPQRDRIAHADALSHALKQVAQDAEQHFAAREAEIAGGTKGLYVEFTLPRAQADIVDKLESRRGRFPIDLVNVRVLDAERVAATVFVPESQKDYYLKKVEAYRNEDSVKFIEQDDGTFKERRRPKNEALIASIDTARLAVARSFYCDQADLFPADDQVVWWEVWIRKGTRAVFDRAVQGLSLSVRERSLIFAEREVAIVHGSPRQIGRIIVNTDCVAELRLARDLPSLFTEMDGGEQHAWSADLVTRLVPAHAEAPAVCLLDTGSTHNHPLIAPHLNLGDMHAYDPTWTVADTSLNHRGHGTQMSGIALYGDLTEVLDGTGQIEFQHRLETVKILPDFGAHKPDLYGAITTEAISRAEIVAPQRARAICLAITGYGNRQRGQPSSWSAQLDTLTFGRDEIERFIAVSAGNITDTIHAANYPARNDTMPIENPAQSWNSLTVGAISERTLITDPTFAGWAALGRSGDLMPRSRTSVSWGHQWPLKPDVVFEGGNLATDPGSGQGDAIDDLSLLTTYHKIGERAFTTTGDTSAATALAARMAAQIMAHRPTLRAETVRGLIVHSAEWTEAMKSSLPAIGRTTQLRRYGFGVPSLARALGSLDNDVTIVSEDQLRPFKMRGNEAVTDQLKVHQLPWPRETLLWLGETLVQLRITLSYFIEPNPGERGMSRRHTYPSHGLRFELKHADESLDVFLRRRNSEAGVRPKKRAASDTGWTLGPQLRHRGSLHGDIWEGMAVDLANRDAIIVYPTGGWWRENVAQGHAGENARYSLIASIRAAPGVALYTEITTPIVPEILIEI